MLLLITWISLIFVAIKARINDTNQFANVQIPIIRMTMKLRMDLSTTNNASISIGYTTPTPTTTPSDCDSPSIVRIDAITKSNATQRMNDSTQYPTNVPTVKPYIGQHWNHTTRNPTFASSMHLTKQNNSGFSF